MKKEKENAVSSAYASKCLVHTFHQLATFYRIAILV